MRERYQEPSVCEAKPISDTKVRIIMINYLDVRSLLSILCANFASYLPIMIMCQWSNADTARRCKHAVVWNWLVHKTQQSSGWLVISSGRLQAAYIISPVLFIQDTP